MKKFNMKKVATVVATLIVTFVVTSTSVFAFTFWIGHDDNVKTESNLNFFVSQLYAKEADNVKLNNDVTKLTDEKTALTTNLNELTGKVTQLEQKLAEAQNSGNQSNDRIKQLESELAGKQQEIQNKLNEIQQKNDRINELNNELSVVKSERDNLKSQVANKEAELNNVKNERDGWKLGKEKSDEALNQAAKEAKDEKTPDDICYIYNFKEPERPNMIKLKSGCGRRFKESIEENIEKIREKSRDLFYSDEYEDRKNLIYKYYQDQTEEVIVELNEKAKDYGFIFEKIEEGLASIPVIDDKPLSDEEIKLLPKAMIKTIEENSKRLEKDTIDIIKRFKKIEDSLEKEILDIERDIVAEMSEEYLNPIIERFSYSKSIAKYINEVKNDIKENVEEFIDEDSEDDNMKIMLARNNFIYDFFKRYKVNLFIDNSKIGGAPVVNEMSPTYYNLFGKIEYYNEMGCLKTDHTRIKPVAIHKANGGYLLVKIKELLSNPKCWERLKKCILTDVSRIENMSRENMIEECITPEPIPLDMKIILIGDEYTYQLLYYHDEYFKKLFKIKVDFDDEMDRNSKNIERIISFIDKNSRKENIKPFDRSALEEIIEYSSRIIENQNKLTTKFSEILELMYEADAWARLECAGQITSDHIKKAIDERIYRNSKSEEKLQEMICSGKLMIDVDCEKIGEINGLAVIGTGVYSFGKPTKITASTYLGSEGITNIEREVGRSGGSHDKGVFILSGFLGEEFGRIRPLSLSASITFEQCYGRIDGDSASSTELYALLSSLADLPINQGIATTGSVNQRGMVQIIGGVNEKIEGFFKVCKEKGLTGEQGVIIPFMNVENLMLSEEVIDAVDKGKFTIYGIKNVKEGIEILTGVEYGERDKKGKFKSETIGYLVDKKLKEYSQIMKKN